MIAEPNFPSQIGLYFYQFTHPLFIADHGSKKSYGKTFLKSTEVQPSVLAKDVSEKETQEQRDPANDIQSLKSTG